MRQSCCLSLRVSGLEYNGTDHFINRAHFAVRKCIALKAYKIMSILIGRIRKHTFGRMQEAKRVPPINTFPRTQVFDKCVDIFFICMGCIKESAVS